MEVLFVCLFLLVGACTKENSKEIPVHHDFSNSIQSVIPQIGKGKTQRKGPTETKEISNLDSQGNDEFERVSVLEGANSQIIAVDQNYAKIVDKTFGATSSTSQTVSLAASSNDWNENNDSLSSATTLFTATDGFYYNISSTLSGTINQKTGFLWQKYIDRDFYRIDVIFWGRLNVILRNIPSACDYDLRVYQMPNNLSANYNSSSVVAWSYNGGSINETIWLNVTPGTYYIEVFSKDDETYNNSSYYQLYCSSSVMQNPDTMSYDIDNGRTSGDLGAVWVSDFRPMGIIPSSLSTAGVKTQYTCYDTYPMIKNLADAYDDADLMYAVLYVWDVGVRSAISQIANAILNATVAYSAWQENANKTVNVVFGVSSILFTVAGILLLNCQIAGLVVGIAALAISIAGLLISSALPPAWDVTKAQFREYLINLKAAMEVGSGSTNQEVVMMKIRYSFTSENVFLGVKRYIDCTPHYVDGETNIYNESVIEAHRFDTPLMGQVHGFHDSSLISQYLK